MAKARSTTNALNEAVRCLHAGDVQQAERVCRQILARDKQNPHAMAVLGQIATMGSRHEEAVRLLTRSVSLAPRQVDYHVLLAEALATQGDHREAIARYDRALKLQPGYPPALAGKANVLTRSGQWADARATLEPFVEAGREDAGMAVVYARAATHDGDHDRAVEVASRHVDDQVADEIRRSLWFDMGRAHERAGRYEQAFDAYTRGNEMGAGGWDPEASSGLNDRITSVFSRETLEALPHPEAPSDLAVFIVGMPRSGSTLIEQIIDAHPDAFGAGEILALPDLAGTMGERIGSTLPYPECVRDLDRQDVDALAKAYLDQLRTLAPQAARICDKNLGNFQHVGLIAVLFPGARIIHSRRRPLDTCLSCYVQKFAPGTHTYSRDLRHLGLFYNGYLSVMAHWRQVLGDRMLEVDYERLVADQEAVTRRIIEHCGLPWDDRCLRFFETKRQVLTLSRDQVSRPVYASSVGRARHYLRQLGPLREVLDLGPRGPVEA
jgi:tetratricopeptide (TPR) repeat protein